MSIGGFTSVVVSGRSQKGTHAWGSLSWGPNQSIGFGSLCVLAFTFAELVEIRT